MAANGGLRTPLAAPFQNSDWMHTLEGNSLPVVATPALFFLQLQHYAPDSVRPRVLYTGDYSLALEFDHAATGETNMFRFQRMLPIHVEEFNNFMAAHPHFLLAAETSTPTWHIPALLQRGAQLHLLNRTNTYFIFDVSFSGK